MLVRFLDILCLKDQPVAVCVDGVDIFPGGYVHSAAVDFLSSEEGIETRRFVSDYRVIAGFHKPDWAFPRDASLLFCDGDSDFSKSPLFDQTKLRQADDRLRAHLKACAATDVDVTNVDIRHVIPDHVLRTYFKSRFDEISRVVSEKDVGADHHEQFEVYRTLLEVERHGIHVDRGLLESTIRSKDFETMEKHVRRFFLGTNVNQKDGYVFARFSPSGSKTLRFRSVGGFDPMVIPHGICREVITSRFDGGSIVSFDFNAIDFRCIIRGTEDAELISMYAGAPDFHAVTANKIFGKLYDDPELRSQIREVTKKLTYVHIYGGSPETIAKTSHVKLENVQRLLADFDEKFHAITSFRKRLSDQFRSQGVVAMPDGKRIPVDPGAHDGKVIGLYAQTYSSRVFTEAFRRAHEFVKNNAYRSKVIFTVHDELVLDLHPRDEDLLPSISDFMSPPKAGFVVKTKRGKNYEQATQ